MRNRHEACALARSWFDATGVSRLVGAATREALLDAAVPQTYAKGQLFYRRGDAVTHLHVLLEGTVEVALDGPDGRHMVCWYFAPGHWMGLIPLLDGEGSIHDYRAHTDVAALAVPRGSFLRAIDQDPRFGKLCLRMLSKRSRSLFEIQAADVLLPLRVRVIRLLLMLTDQQQTAATEDGGIDLRFTQEHISALLGVSRQSLNRELSTLQSEGLIALAYSRIRVTDVGAMRASIPETLAL